MARYKHIVTSPRFISVDLQRQLLSGTFEHALNHLIDHALDLSGFDYYSNAGRFGRAASTNKSCILVAADSKTEPSEVRQRHAKLH